MAQDNASTKRITDIDERLKALEGGGLSEDATITRIQKAYLSLGVKVTVNAYVHQYDFASDPTSFPVYDGSDGQPTGNYALPQYASTDKYI